MSVDTVTGHRYYISTVEKRQEIADMTNVTFIKTQNAQPTGVYQPTTVDAAKGAADFRILQVGPIVIRWQDGRTETVTKRQLAKLQTVHTSMTDF